MATKHRRTVARARWRTCARTGSERIACLALRVGGEASRLAASRLGAVGLLEITPEIRRRAEEAGPPDLRALDAIHLATALSVTDQIGTVLTYDVRLTSAARSADLAVAAPA